MAKITLPGNKDFGRKIQLQLGNQFLLIFRTYERVVQGQTMNNNEQKLFGMY